MSLAWRARAEMLDEVVDTFLAGVYDYETAVRLAEAITDETGFHPYNRQAFLSRLDQKRREHHEREEA